ncbi:MAG: ATP-binding protein [Polaromonas sp.]|nr:ATP-binding protein [Polaromonas sp.]
MSSHLSLELMADLTELERLNDALDQLAQTQRWSAESLFQIKLALEEVVVNVISYGAEGGRLPRIHVELRQDAARLEIEVADDGIAFDPLQKAVPDLDASLENRPIGGLGVYLVRQLMDSVRYQRDAGQNKLSITKTLAFSQ